MTLVDLGEYAAALTACAMFIGLIVKWLVVLPIKTYIDQMTYPIQPHSNGGKSLPDAIATLSRIESKILDLDGRLRDLENDTPKHLK